MRGGDSLSTYLSGNKALDIVHSLACQRALEAGPLDFSDRRRGRDRYPAGDKGQGVQVVHDRFPSDLEGAVPKRALNDKKTMVINDSRRQ